MKILIVILSLYSFPLWAEVPLEPSWKSKVRTYLTRLSPAWSDKILGKLPVPVAVIELPVIPKQFTKNTDTTSYNRKEKEPTEFDRLPAERKRQFDYGFIQELFKVTRKSDAKDEDLSTWLNTLDQGGSREGIYQALVLDDVYATLENMDERPTERLTNFAAEYARKYLVLNYKIETLQKYNLYTLKRIMTEKSLDLLDHYEMNDLDSLYRWYAVLSTQLAVEQAQFLKSPLRQDTSMEYHYQWAKSMPIQHIKSEFIIKLHIVMNGLQLLQ